MKKTILCMMLAVLTGSAYATDTLRLNMQAFLDDYPQDSTGKWIHTMDGGYPSMDFEYFRFSHLTNALQAQGSDPNGMQYWDGFTICTNGDNTDYGFAGSSTEWPTHQWGCMAGGGIDSTGNVVQGAPYLVAYWGYNYEAEGVRSLQVDWLDDLTHRPLGIWICNHPWAYYGIQHDDGFAHSFADNGALFELTVHGLDEENKDAGMPIVVPLATFHDDSLDISDEWIWVDLSAMGQVKAIYFSMESTDMAGVLGMNTAAFFCLGGMEILEHVDEIGRPAGLEAEALDENRIKVRWNSVEDAAYYRVYVDSVLVDSTAAKSYIFTDLETYTSYRFFVQAVSAYGESSEWGYVTGRTKDLTPPTAPTNLHVTETGAYKIALAWDAATDNVEVNRYVVYVDGTKYSRPKTTNVSITGLDPGTKYLIEVETLDTSGNASERTGIHARTLWPTDVEQVEEETQRTIYTVTGQPVANAPKGQVHIVQTGNETSKQIQQ